MDYTIVIHGGAGTILKQDMTPELELDYKSGLDDALEKAGKILENNGSAIDAVKMANIVLENNILFNAGRGSVFSSNGHHEMDAAIMDGKDLSAGAVTCIHGIKNPIELSYKIMVNKQHVFLSGKGALEFAANEGLELEDDQYFFSEFRYKQWKAISDTDVYLIDHSSVNKEESEKKFGTVGAVAVDKHGNIAAATSTGGMTNKKFGRIGDTPIIGAGTYANNATCAISCTGHGEIFMRAVAAYDVSCLMEYKGLSLQDAMHKVVHEKLIALNGEGGMIGVDAKGNYAMLFNSEGMYRGIKNNKGYKEISIYK
ncbi:MAG: isoaspartyl peptidase/L-asparaginase [Flavisolibacter sp.]|nr:isoaspartyl peptidase/L-asparaginase [Flavisolibacter sp.]